MKRIENLVIGGIESKMLALVLISMLLVAAVFVVSMLTQNTMLTKLTQETSERQLASMTGTTTAVIDTVIVENLDRITDLEAAVTDQLFRDQAVGVRPVSEYAGKLLSNPDSVPPAPWQRPDVSRDGELSGTERMIQALNAAPDAAPMDVLKNMRAAVDSFVKNAEQFDDLTMLCLEYKGPQ